ncbi:MAG: hypothetical protein AAFO57_00030 [Pseudomonadota bacterium]
MAKVILKSAFALITDDHRRHEFAPGEQEIPDELADHWYVLAHCEPKPEAYDAPEVVAESAETPDETVEVIEPRKPGRPKKS